jgi:hypothetical protein
MVVRNFWIAVLGIAIPLAVIAFDEDVIVLVATAVVIIGGVGLLWTFESVHERYRRLSAPVDGSLRQALVASSATLACGVGAALSWSEHPVLRFGLLAAALISVNWWLQVLLKMGISRLVVENRNLRSQITNLEDQVTQLSQNADENERIKAVMRHVMNVLLGLEAAKEGYSGVGEIGAAAWIEHVCLRSTRNVLERLAGHPDGYKVELGILKVPNEVVFVEMAAGELLRQYQEEGGCPVRARPDAAAIAKILEQKAEEGGFVDSDSVEFKLNGESHHMVVLSAAPLDDMDREMLSLIASMFIVLKLSLQDH